MCCPRLLLRLGTTHCTHGSGLRKVLVTKGDLQLHQGQAASSTGPHIPMAFADRGRPCPLPSGMSQLRGTLGLAQVTVPPDNPISAWEMSPFGSFQAKQRQIHHLTLHYLLSSHHHRSSRDAKHLLAAVGCRGSFLTLDQDFGLLGSSLLWPTGSCPTAVPCPLPHIPCAAPGCGCPRAGPLKPRGRCEQHCRTLHGTAPEQRSLEGGTRGR